MKNFLSLIIIILALISPSAYKTSPLYGDNNNSIKLKKSLDTSLENIDSALRSNDFKKVCAESLYSQQIITKNISELRKLEPYYDWHQMNSVIKNISKKFCLARNPHNET
tara:strand:- start:75 stop:404 length:330 start_codon:yes stop_codon:yes gene_type:complete